MTLCEQLKEVIDRYLDGNPHTSINSLSNKSNVGASTIRRIVSKSVKGDPSPHTVLSLTSAVTNEKKIGVLVNMFDGPLGKSLKDSFGAFVEIESPHGHDPNLNELLEDRVSYIIYKLAANRIGVSKIEIGQHFGAIGIEKLKYLLEKGVLIEKDDKFHAAQKKFSLDINILTKHLPELVKYYEPNKVDEGLNVLYNLSESINEDGVRKIKEIVRNAAKNIYRIMNSPYYEGHIPYFSVLLADSLQINMEGDLIQ